MKGFVGFPAAVCRVICREIRATRHRVDFWNQSVGADLSGLSGFIRSRDLQRNQDLKIVLRSSERAERVRGIFPTRYCGDVVE